MYQAWVVVANQYVIPIETSSINFLKFSIKTSWHTLSSFALHSFPEVGWFLINILSLHTYICEDSLVMSFCDGSTTILYL